MGNGIRIRDENELKFIRATLILSNPSVVPLNYCHLRKEMELKPAIITVKQTYTAHKNETKQEILAGYSETKDQIMVKS